MVLLAIGCLLAGVLCGQFFFTPEGAAMLAPVSDGVLYLLMFSVGISVGSNRQIFAKLRQYRFKLFVIPLGIIVSSIAGGFLCAPFLAIPLRDSVCIAGGLGWYSLSGVLLTELSGADVGTIAFLSNLFRELFAFLSIPWIAKHLNYYAAIAPAAATSEDTTLPMMIRFTSEEVTVLAVFNGILCSAAVPVLINFFHSVL